jgi:SAM-dependent methyltransferase
MVDNVTPPEFYFPGRMDPQDDEHYWNTTERIQQNTDHPTSEGIVNDPLVNRMIEIADRYGLADEASILDIGCGGGRFLTMWDLARQRKGASWKLSGLDHSPRAADIAKSNVPSAHIYTGTLRDIQFPRKLDVVYTNTVFQHNSGWKQSELYLLIRNLLVPQGYLWLINELTLDTTRVLEFHKQFNPFAHDERCSHGTAAWWIQRICSFNFELISYSDSEYLFRAG